MASKYKKLTPVDHVLLRPEMYVGSVESQQTPLFLLDETSKKMEWTTAQLNHGLLKIVDEILLNAADNIHNSKKKPMTFINVTVDAATGAIVVENDGAGIPIVKSREHKVLVPEMIFGHLLTSSNYDNDPDSVTAGRHGYGAKLTNIMSSVFALYCRHQGQEVTIKWSDHMRHMEPYAPAATVDETSLTRVSFTPDFSLFGMQALSDDMFRILKKRVVDLAAASPDVSITLNGELFKFASFNDYAALYQSDAFLEHGSFVYDSKRCRIAFVPNPQPTMGRRYFGVVNGVVTYSGGAHVTAAQDVIAAAVDTLAAQRKKEGVVVNTGTFLRHFVVIIFIETPQPKFDSQSKVRLVSQVKLPRIAMPDVVAFVAKMPFLNTMSSNASDLLAKEINALVQPSKKKPMISSLTKLVDAASAGGKGGEDNIRTLIVTEGDSAKALALNSLSNEQRKYFGVFPLRGKLLNVRNNNIARLRKCKELCELFASLGLEVGARYSSVETLRYQRVLIMTDQDADGTHIKGLLISAFESLWPTLLHKHPGFLSIFSTPLIRATTRGGDVHSFYSRKEFDAWKVAHPKLSKECFIKYYKGLGTSTTTEGKEYFKDMDNHLMRVVVTPDDKQLMDNVFDSDEVQWRKEWLTGQAAVDEVDLDRNLKSLTLSAFVEKELVHFAFAGNLRALPSAIDGLKPSQRKILWACFRRGISESLKVSQLSGYISEVSAFHHGEVSLQQTIVKMAQDFIGSNNVNLLEPEGQFGSRQHLGGDHAAARYIFTKLSPMARLLFPQEDDELLSYIEDEGKLVEPRFYVPIIPMLLVNGSVGIGFGFASTVQPHHPLDVVRVVRRLIHGATVKEAMMHLCPWAVGFNGTVARLVSPDSTGNAFVATGRYTTRKVKGFPVVRVEELPWDRSIEHFRMRVAGLAESGKVLRIADYSGANHIDADVVLAHDSIKHVGKELLLSSNVNNNATVYSPSMVLTPLGDNLEQAVAWHYEQRLALYAARKKRQLEHLNRQLGKLTSTAAFTDKVRNNAIDFRTITDDGLTQLCVKWGLQREDDSFDYLTRRPITFFTNTNVEKLKRDIQHCKDKIATLEAKTVTMLWEADLTAFERAFEEREADMIAKVDADRRPTFSAPEVDGLAQAYDTEAFEHFRRKRIPMHHASTSTSTKHKTKKNIDGPSGGTDADATGEGTGGAMVVRPWFPMLPPTAGSDASSRVAQMVATAMANVALRVRSIAATRLLFL